MTCVVSHNCALSLSLLWVLLLTPWPVQAQVGGDTVGQFPRNIGAIIGAAQACGVPSSRIRAMMEEAFRSINAATPSEAQRESYSKALYASYVAMVGHSDRPENFKSRGGNCDDAQQLFSYAEGNLKSGAIPDSLKREQYGK